MSDTTEITITPATSEKPLSHFIFQYWQTAKCYDAAFTTRQELLSSGAALEMAFDRFINDILDKRASTLGMNHAEQA